MGAREHLRMFGDARSQARRRMRWGAGFVTLALVGEWLGHTVTWLLSGGVGPGPALSGPMHTYLGPAGAVLVLVAVAVSWLTWRGLSQLGRLTASLHRALCRIVSLSRPRASRPGTIRRRVRRRHPAAGPGSAVDGSSPRCRWRVYLAQENLEIHLLGLPAPRLHVLTAHWGLPLLVHGVVAFAGAVIAISVLDRWGAHLDEALHVARLYVTLAAPQTPVATWSGDLVPAPCPVRLFGLSFLSRPPPAWMVI